MPTLPFSLLISEQFSMVGVMVIGWQTDKIARIVVERVMIAVVDVVTFGNLAVFIHPDFLMERLDSFFRQ